MTSPRETPRWLSVLILAGLSLSVSPHQILTRTDEVSRALSPVLSRYEVIRMEPGEIERQVRTTGELRLRFEGAEFYFNLEPHDMRAPDYRAEVTGPGGVRRTLTPQPVHTYKGVLAGREETRGRFNLTGAGVEGVVYAPEGWVYVEPLRNYLPEARAGELVVYRQEDLKAGGDVTCDLSLPGRLRRGAARVAAQAEAVPPTNYIADIATEADYEYVQEMGGTVEANREIEGILNVVEEVFQSELLVGLRISFQHAWETEEDPYTGTTMDSFVIALRLYWNENFAAEQDYDLVHLWTGRQDLDKVGRASGQVCHSRDNNLPVSTSISTSKRFDSSFKYYLATHEIAHNLGASDLYNDIPPIPACMGTLMNTGPGLTLCQFSREEIARYLADYNSCLDTRPIGLQPPGGLSARATSASGIHLSWRDNSANETGFKVERRREGSWEWGRIGTTPADTTTFTSEGLFSEATYLYRVQAFNDSESSAYSNEAAATTRSAPEVAAGWRIDTLAGRTDNDGDEGPAVRARLASPYGVAVDGSGNVYIADRRNHRIRRVDRSGTITTVAGTGERGFGGDGGPAVAARLNEPTRVALDISGALYIADRGNHRIRRVDGLGIVTTVAGNGEIGFSGDGGPAVEARLKLPQGMAVDGSGALYIADTWNRRIRRVDASGTITTVAGSGGRGYGGDGGPAVRTSLNVPAGVAVDGLGNLYIAESEQNRVLRVDTSGIITTMAGNGEIGFSGDGGPAVEAWLNTPLGVTVDEAGNVYIADWGNHRIRRVDGSGIITTIAGTGERGFSGDGGPAVEASLWHPEGVTVDGGGNLYIADWGNHRIRRVDGSGVITTIAGIGESGFGGDGGPAAGAWLNTPLGVAVDTSGNVYIADTYNDRIRRVDGSGIITTVAGTGESGFGGDGGPAGEAQLDSPRGVAVDGSGNLFIADANNGRIRRVNSLGAITKVASRLHWPTGVAVDGLGNVYIADTVDHRIRRVDAGGTLTTIAGIGESGFSGDGGPAVEARLNHPRGVAVDEGGNVYIADTWNQRIRRVDPSGGITTVAGIGEGGDSGGAGPATEAVLDWPVGVAVDGSGNLYIADTYNNRIRRVDTSGTLTTIAGTGVRGYSGDGGLAATAQLNDPTGVAVDEAGKVYVADSRNHRIRVLTRLPPPPDAPTRLKAAAVSPFRIDLSWQDNSDEEEGFGVQRRVEGSSDWIDIGATPADLTTYSDTGLEPTTSYRYRVRAYRNIVASAFSNEAAATTPRVMPPTLMRFIPAGGQSVYKSLSLEPIFTAPPPWSSTELLRRGSRSCRGRGSRPWCPGRRPADRSGWWLRGGAVTSAESFTVTDSGIGSRLFVPIVLRGRGRTPGSFFTSEPDPHQSGNRDGRHPLHLYGSLRRGLGHSRGCPGPRPATGHSRRHRLSDLPGRSHRERFGRRHAGGGILQPLLPLAALSP